MIDNRLSFKAHVKYVSVKVSRIQSALAGMLPNVGGPKYRRRVLLSSVVSSVILYAAPVWASAMSVQKTRNKISSIYRRSALRTICGYRTNEA